MQTCISKGTMTGVSARRGTRGNDSDSRSPGFAFDHSQPATLRDRKGQTFVAGRGDMKIIAAIAILLLTSIPTYAKNEPPLKNGEHYADVNGVTFWYEIVGSGPLLIIQAPGWGAGSTYLQNGLAPLSKDFTMLFYDTRGSGRSTRPPDETRMSTSDMVDDLEGLRKYWGLESMTILGHSHGGEIALDYAVRYPNRARKLILVDAALSGYDASADRKKQIEARANDKRFSEAIAEVNNSKEPATDQEFGAGLHRMLPLYFYDPERNQPVFEKTEAVLPSAWVLHNFGAAENKQPMNVTDKMGSVRAETLVVVGNEDWVCPVSVAERIHTGIAGSKLVMFPHTGHFPWIEDPQEFFDSVTKFAGK
jgi:proline iminopeptidase